MNILVDAFGGDHAPLEALKGCRRAVDKLGVRATLVGREAAVRACAAGAGVSLAGMEILEAPDVFEMAYEPQTVAREHSDTSLAVGLRALAEGRGDAFVSAGSTGALLVGGTLLVKRMRGVRRGAIGALLPTAAAPVLLLDAGANAACSAEMLWHFALLGSVYMQAVRGVARPRVALANIGAEANKGDPLRREAYQILEEQKQLHFIGNLEARDIPMGRCDVLIADGFTGNVILKLYEGMAQMLTQKWMRVFTGNVLGYFGLPFALPGLVRLKKTMDYKRHGGAPVLGLNGVVIKAHGSSDATAFYHAVGLARRCVERGMAPAMARQFAQLKKG